MDKDRQELFLQLVNNIQASSLPEVESAAVARLRAQRAVFNERRDWESSERRRARSAARRAGRAFVLTGNYECLRRLLALQEPTWGGVERAVGGANAHLIACNYFEWIDPSSFACAFVEGAAEGWARICAAVEKEGGSSGATK